MVEAMGRMKILHRRMEHLYPIREWRFEHILASLTAGFSIDVDSNHLRRGKSLRHHQGNEPRARADV